MIQSARHLNLLQIIRSERFRRLFNESFWIVLGQALTVVGSLVGVRILTGLLVPAKYGELALGMTITTLVNQTVLGPLCNGIIRYYAPAAENNDLNCYANAVLRMVLSATGVIVVMILLVDFGLLITSRTELIAIATAALVYSIFSGYNSILSGIQNAARQRSIVALHQGLESWGRYLLAAGFILWLGATSTVAMFGYIFAVILVIGSQIIFFRNIFSRCKISTLENQRSWREKMWTFSWPFSIWGGFTWLQQVSDRWALKLFTSSYEVGLYSVLYQLGYYPIALATGMVLQLLMPIIYKQAGIASEASRNEKVNKMSLYITGFALVITGFAFMMTFYFHAQLFKIFVDNKYLPVSYLLPWIIVSGGVFAAGESLAMYIQSQMKTREMMSVKIYTALLGVALNFFGAYWFGITGIVYASVLFSLCYFLWMFKLTIKHR